MTITKDVLYVGVNDHEIDLFEGHYDVPNGMAYNSYVIKDQKTAVMDTVDRRFTQKNNRKPIMYCSEKTASLKTAGGRWFPVRIDALSIHSLQDFCALIKAPSRRGSINPLSQRTAGRRPLPPPAMQDRIPYFPYMRHTRGTVPPLLPTDIRSLNNITRSV